MLTSLPVKELSGSPELPLIPHVQHAMLDMDKTFDFSASDITTLTDGCPASVLLLRKTNEWFLMQMNYVTKYYWTRENYTCPIVPNESYKSTSKLNLKSESLNLYLSLFLYSLRLTTLSKLLEEGGRVYTKNIVQFFVVQIWM